MQTTISPSNGLPKLHLVPDDVRGLRAAVPVGEEVARVLGAVGVFSIGLIHILDAADTYHSTRWIFFTYMTLVAASVVGALLLLQWPSPLAWVAAAGIALGPLVAYLWSRSVGLPGDAGDIGNWLDTLGMSALFVESSLLMLAVARLRYGRTAR